MISSIWKRRSSRIPPQDTKPFENQICAIMSPSLVRQISSCVRPFPSWAALHDRPLLLDGSPSR